MVVVQKWVAVWPWCRFGREGHKKVHSFENKVDYMIGWMISGCE